MTEVMQASPIEDCARGVKIRGWSKDLQGPMEFVSPYLECGRPIRFVIMPMIMPVLQEQPVTPEWRAQTLERLAEVYEHRAMLDTRIRTLRSQRDDE